jgi:hypothetical protein
MRSTGDTPEEHVIPCEQALASRIEQMIRSYFMCYKFMLTGKGAFLIYTP